MKIIKVIWKHQIRNKTKQMPEGLLLLGKIGRLLYSSSSERIAYIVLFLFLIVIHWLFQKEFNVEDIEISNFHVLGIILSLMIYDSYTKSYYANLNYSFIKIFPYSFIKKISIFFIYEIINLKLTILLFYIILSFVFSRNIMSDILLGINCFVFYNLISVIITLLQLKFKYRNSTAINYLFNVGYLGTWIAGMILKNYLAFLVLSSALLVIILVFLFKIIYDKIAFLYTQD